MFQPRVSSDMFLQFGNEYVVKSTGEVLTNPLQVQMLSDLFEKSKKQELTKKQTRDLSYVLGIEEYETITPFELTNISQNIEEINAIGGTSNDVFDYVSRENQETQPRQDVLFESDNIGKLMFDNFISMVRERINDDIAEMLLAEFDKLPNSDSEIGRAIDDVNKKIDFETILGYMSLDSKDAVSDYSSRLIEYLPISEEAKKELEKEFDEFSVQGGR